MAYFSFGNFIIKSFQKYKITIMTIYQFKISNNQTNIDKYRLAANIIEYHILSKLRISDFLSWVIVDRSLRVNVLG